MARTLAQIQTEIDVQIAATPALSGLTSTSPQSIWGAIKYIVAYAIFIHESLWDIFKEELEDIAKRAVPATARWLQYQALQYQDGYVLTWNADTLKYEYSTIDTTAQIVKLAAVNEQQGSLVQLKVAKLDGSGNPIPLTTVELASFQGYIYDIKVAGQVVQVISESADLMSIGASTIYYDPSFQSTTIQTNVEAAINSYLENLPFNGIFRLSALVDAIQAVEGIIDIQLGTVQARYLTNPFATISLDYQSYAGYISIDPATPLSSNLTYSPVF